MLILLLHQIFLSCTVKFKLLENEVEVSGGGLNGTYSAIQFHFHWGDTAHHSGSEHKIDGFRYPMEVDYCTNAAKHPQLLLMAYFTSRCLISPCNISQMHIVSLKKGLTVQEATEDSAGIAVLGFFLNVCRTL